MSDINYGKKLLGRRGNRRKDENTPSIFAH